MKFEMSKWNVFIKIVTIISGLVVIVAVALNSFTDIFIPGLVPIALGINLLGLGLKELNIFKENKQKFNLISGAFLILTFILSLHVGIEQI